MLQIDHRSSHDIDIFIDDPQVLSLLNPDIQGYQLTTAPTDYETDGARSLKLVFKGVGEIDFICCGHLAENPTFEKEVCGRAVRVETPGEIIAKKIHYRSKHIQPRDIFDLVAAVRTLGFEAVVSPLRAMPTHCVEARNAVLGMSPELAENIMGQLMEIRPQFRDIPTVGKEEAVAILDRVINSILK